MLYGFTFTSWHSELAKFKPASLVNIFPVRARKKITKVETYIVSKAWEIAMTDCEDIPAALSKIIKVAATSKSFDDNLTGEVNGVPAYLDIKGIPDEQRRVTMPDWVDKPRTPLRLAMNPEDLETSPMCMKLEFQTLRVQWECFIINASHFCSRVTKQQPSFWRSRIKRVFDLLWEQSIVTWFLRDRGLERVRYLQSNMAQCSVFL